MKLVIDLQGAQCASKQRGIGRYSLALAEAMARQAGGHELWIALNSAFGDTIEPLRATFDNLLPQKRIAVWETPTPVADIDPANGWRRRTGEILRESFLASLKPDIVHISSLFEGLIDETVTSVSAFSHNRATAVTLYDLIPLMYRDTYLPDPRVETWYQRKLTSFRQADLWLAISESSRNEGIAWLNLSPEKVVNISAAADSRFRPARLGQDEAEALRRRYGLTRPFIMYAGATDPRKNLNRLLGAYRKLPAKLSRDYQLLIVCPVADQDVSAIRQHARRQGIADDAIVIAPFISDSDLIKFYNLCVVFCLPSLHEGFGLPALEAMQCGAPTIGSNTSSIPEVIGRADALFDPHNEEDIASRLHHVLTDPDYRQSLAMHGPQQARRFSWSESARRAWEAFEAHYDEITKTECSCTPATTTKRLRLAYVFPHPTDRSEIANHDAELLPELSRHYDIDIIVDQSTASNSRIATDCSIRDIAWLVQNSHLYDRILYHYSNSPLHRRMLDLQAQHPGIIVLHGFHPNGITSHSNDTDIGLTRFWPYELYRSYGYSAVHDCRQSKNIAEVDSKYPINFSALQNASGVIVCSDYQGKLAKIFCANDLSDWAVIPRLRCLPLIGDRRSARKLLGLGINDFVVCCFGALTRTKLHHRLLQAWLASALETDQDCHLVFVGPEDDTNYASELRRIIAGSPAKKRIRVTGPATQKLYQQYLCVADLAVHLDAPPQDEMSDTVFDCMGHGLPTIINAHDSNADLPKDCLIVLPNEFSDGELVTVIEALHVNPERRDALGKRARYYVTEHFSPSVIADRYHTAIEHFSAHGREALKKRTLTALVAVEPAHENELEWLALARATNFNIPASTSKRQLLIDISILVQGDAKTGIQRVTRNILRELLLNPPVGVSVEPIYAAPGQPGYRYARNFTFKFLGCSVDIFDDAPIELRRGDIYLGLDLDHYGLLNRSSFYVDMRRAGVEIYFVIYDLLPIRLPHLFPKVIAELHSPWMSALSVHADGVIGISRAVAAEIAEWLDGSGIHRLRPLRIGWFHLGADTEAAHLTHDLPDGAEHLLAALASRPSFLMVGTIEPRKGYSQALAAFDRLWTDDVNTNLIIVGKQGWKMEPLVEKLRQHSELGKRLFWLEGISDEYLNKIYTVSACLIAASEGEGFGLPLIEAARNKILILARNIPVFREVAGPYASYFSGKSGDDLADAIRDWLALFAKNKHPKSVNMPWLTWAQSAERLKAILLSNEWPVRWLPPKEESTEKQNAISQEHKIL